VPSIAQICLNDQGAALNSLRNIWTTYLKTRFSCAYDTSKSADQEGFFKFDPTFQTSTLFYFDELSNRLEIKVLILVYFCYEIFS